MKRTTLFIEEELEEEIKRIARLKGKKTSEVVREALRDYVKRHRSKKTLSFVGIGKSGRKDLSETHEEELWER
ncbi:type II toxin-antitoxin system VapB family antitoxin [Hydrogenivirga sp. 128-5-R1-1]|uniref:type II toxin-antitoxin system VapB family antitoxin n=1 Tax=Hydrogenivirga sp. 128-5-R1-1 TaxID=392423 RepID=UPI00015F18E0|nr:type II toxin-antitoxin system VapB family antitoxin [Hydrogenivirga sp. 128-5-R1-1]EDP75463.1 hypothetical protein HG1285_15901 [Hydrogenivirga sp. 128-5-R1-1]